ncbi:hypothetical protein JL720_14264 [Aureococcus anophagefferens]|nr:hypothetical protein JL720_14264 [Aureococcus anophagefferens]
MLKGIIKIQAITRGKHMRENEVKLRHNDNDRCPTSSASVTTASDLGSEHDLVAFNDPATSAPATTLGTIVPIIKIQAIARKKYVLVHAHDSRYAQEHQRPDLDTKARPQATVDKPTRPREERPKWHDEAKNDLQAWVDSHAPTCTIAAATPPRRKDPTFERFTNP